jgi:hypothetical protein
MRILTLTFVLLMAELSAAADKSDTFIWSSREIGGKVYPKAAILVPVDFRGVNKKFRAQLDTGSDATIFYGKILRKLGVLVDSVNDGTPAFRWYGHNDGTGSLERPTLIDWTIESDIDTASAAKDNLVIGTIGLDKVVDKILVLDFPGTKYIVLDDTASLSEALPVGVEFVDGVVSYNKLYINIMLGQDTLPAVRYDCGSSVAALIIPRDWWQWSTGRDGGESDVLRDSVPSWGKFVHLLTAPSKYDMSIGNFRIKNPLVTFVDWTDPSLATGKFLGNAAFSDSCVVVVDCIRQKFGIGTKR